MSDPQEYKTINEQINLLKARNLSFEDEKYARHCLREYGYYSIINGYKEPYLDNPKGTEDHYKDGVTFEQILSLFRTENVEHTLRDYLNLRPSATSLSEAATTTEFTTASN